MSPKTGRIPLLEDPESRARMLAQSMLVVDGHVDLPWRLYKGRRRDGRPSEDVAGLTLHGDFDAVRARRGGLDAPFMSIYVPVEYEMKGARALADQLIDIVDGLVEGHPETFAHALSPADIRSNFSAGRISLPMGLENGAPLEGELDALEYFYQRGIRYITLAHGEDNHLSDSSYDNRHTHGGLSPFGRAAVRRMNDLGIMVDVSHLSDDAFWDVLEVSRAPVIASHSSCRHFTPLFERNLSDPMILALAGKGGIIQINFGTMFLDDRGRTGANEGEKPHPLSVRDVADHIEHVIAIAGIDAVGLGSDFDGVDGSLPEGLESVADYPNLFAELLARGRTEDELAQIAGGNALRVWEAVEAKRRRPIKSESGRRPR